MKGKVFYWQFLLVPVALPLLAEAFVLKRVTYRVLLVFGVRLVYWTVDRA